MRLIAIRHGEIPLNIENRLSGWIDEELTAKGIQQAQELASNFKTNFSTMIVSPLRRTMHTAQIIAEKHACKIVVDPNLRERNFGSLNGRTWEEIEAETGEDDLRHRDVVLMDYDYRPYGGESAAQVIERTKDFLHSALKYEGSGDLVVVTHGGIIKVLYTLLESEPRGPITNCSVHTFYVYPKAMEMSGSNS